MDEANSVTAREAAVTENPKAIIVGGGIGGLTAGIALRQAGINAVVYERAPEWGDIGAGIALASNAMKVFSKLNLADKITACGVPLASGAIKTWNGKDIIREVGEAHAFISLCVHRADLLDLEDMGKRTFVPAGLKERVNVLELLDGIELRWTPSLRQPEG